VSGGCLTAEDWAVFWEGEMNSNEQEDARRERELLKSEQESHSNTIEELLRRRHGDPCPSDYLDWLAQQRGGKRCTAAAFGRDHARTCAAARLRLVVKQLAELEEQ
jgi:hypothetical protein